jgi:tetratricopeptide (TPR) repeat protein
MGLGVALRSSRSFSHPDRQRTYARAQELAEKLGQTSQLMEVLLGLGVAASGSGQFKAGCEIGERIVAAAQKCGSRAELCAAHGFLGQGLMWRAQLVDAQRHLDLSSSYYDDDDSRWFASWGIDAPAIAAIVALSRGFPAQGRKLFDQALHLAKSCNDRFRLGSMHMWGAVFCELLHDVPAMLEQTQILHRLGSNQPVWAAVGDMFTALALMTQRKLKEGETYLRKAIDLYETAGLESLRIYAKLCEAQLLAALGQFDDALAVTDAAIGLADEPLLFKSRALRMRANLLAENCANASTVEAANRAAIECARSQDAKYFELEATTDFARWLKTQDRMNEARAMLSGVYSWFTEGLETIALNNAKGLLAELSGN